MPQSITFDGAAETVTGSRHLLNLNGKRVLVDCGLFQGSRELRERNWQPLPFNPAAVDSSLLICTPIGPVGYASGLVRGGFPGPISCAAATLGLSSAVNGARETPSGEPWNVADVVEMGVGQDHAVDIRRVEG